MYLLGFNRLYINVLVKFVAYYVNNFTVRRTYIKQIMFVPLLQTIMSGFYKTVHNI